MVKILGLLALATAICAVNFRGVLEIYVAILIAAIFGFVCGVGRKT